jgi:hypothetical protein
MNKLEKIAYNCRKATLLIEKQQVNRLTVGERMELKMHLAGCSVCRVFQQQSLAINKMFRELCNRRANHSKLDNKFKQSLQEQINKKLSI